MRNALLAASTILMASPLWAQDAPPLTEAERQQAIQEIQDLRSRMTAQGADPAYLPGDAFAAYLVAEMPVWAKAVKESGARLD